MKIKIGLSISLSGNYSTQGIESFQGVELWVEQVNKKGGIYVQDQDSRFPIELIYFDDKSLVDQCRSNIETLITDNKVDILLGPYSSSLALAACEVAQNHNITLWNHGGSTDEIQYRDFDNVVSSITPASYYSYGIIDCIRKADPDASKIASFSAKDSGFSSRIADAAIKYAMKKGFEVREYKFLSGSLNFNSFQDDLMSYNPDLILGIGRAEDDIALAKQLAKENIYSKSAAFIVASIKFFKDELSTKAEGALSASQWERGAQIDPDIGPSPYEFYSDFQRKYMKPPDYVAAQGYNIGLVLERCIQTAGTIDDLKLRMAARNAEFDTFYGKFKTDSRGNQMGHEMLVVQWQHGEKVIVYPDNAAQTQIIYPRK